MYDSAVWEEVYSLKTVVPWADRRNDKGGNFTGCGSRVNPLLGCSAVLVLTSDAACRRRAQPNNRSQSFGSTEYQTKRTLAVLNWQSTWSHVTPAGDRDRLHTCTMIQI